MSGPRRRAAQCVALLCLLHAPAAAAAAEAPSYATLRASAVAACRAIDPDRYQSGLAMNPDGYRSYYVRSECLQRAAVQFRDAELCAGVRQRWSLVWSSWGIAAPRCRELVAQGLAADERELVELRARHRAGAVRLTGLRIVPNGNGRDYDALPSFRGAFAHGHRLRLEALGAGPGGRDALIHDGGYWIDGGSELRIFLTAAELRERIPGFAPGRSYRVRATLVLDVGFGGPAAYRSPELLERVFPERERSQAIVQAIAF